MIVQTYDEAVNWLKGGRNKSDRPLYTTGLRLRKINANGDIGVVAPWTAYYGGAQPLVTYHPNGQVTIAAENGLLRSQSVRRIIRWFADLTDVYQKNHNHYFLTKNYGYKPQKIQKCRRCKGDGKLDEMCYIFRWNTGPCEHGETNTHVMPKAQSCWGCHGVGKKDYGSQPIAMLWDGSPVKLIGGNLVNNKPTDLEKAIAAYVNPISS